MPVETAEDRLEMLDPEQFGTAATYKGRTVTGIYEARYAEALPGQETVVDSVEHWFTTSVDQVQGIVLGDEMVIDSATYSVRSKQPDGTGLMRLNLEIE